MRIILGPEEEVGENTHLIDSVFVILLFSKVFLDLYFLYNY